MESPDGQVDSGLDSVAERIMSQLITCIKMTTDQLEAAILSDVHSVRVKRRPQHGFTLLELIISTIILVILTSMAVPSPQSCGLSSPS